MTINDDDDEQLDRMLDNLESLLRGPPPPANVRDILQQRGMNHRTSSVKLRRWAMEHLEVKLLHYYWTGERISCSVLIDPVSVDSIRALNRSLTPIMQEAFPDIQTDQYIVGIEHRDADMFKRIGHLEVHNTLSPSRGAMP